MTTTTRKVFRVLGTTTDITVCELCGRDELKGTTVLEELDADGNGTGGIVYYGSACGAKAAGWTTREIRAAAKAADTAKRDAERAAREAATTAYCNARDAWVLETYGCDMWSVRDADGNRRKSYEILKEFDASLRP